jgi:Cu-Zn family superoxide dismutase
VSGRRAGWAATAAAIGTLAWSGPGFAAGATVAFHRSGVDGANQAIGTVKLDDTQYGLQFTPDLTGLSGGIHNWQARPAGDCPVPGNPPPARPAAAGTAPAAKPDSAAKADPIDLPPLAATASGIVQIPVIAPKLKLASLRGRALVIDAGGDVDNGDPSGPRIACGIVR